MVKKYHGMTLDQIKSKYYVEMDGEENSSQLKFIDGKLSRLWQDVAYYYSDTKTQYEDYKKRMKAVEETIEYKKNQVKWKYITENKVLPHGKKWSDSARETAAAIEVKNDPKTIAELEEIRNNIATYEEELAIWHEVRNNLRFIADRVDNCTMNSGIEGKMQRREPSNIPQNEHKNEREESIVKDQDDLF